MAWGTPACCRVVQTVCCLFRRTKYLLTLSKSLFGRWVKNAFYVSGKTIWGETTNWTKNLFRSNFGTWTGKCGPFRETFQYAGQNGTLHRQRIILKSAYRFKVWLSLFFVDFEQKEVSPFAKSFGSCVKTAFYVLRESVWRNMFFWRKKSASMF